tara:strand:- start:1416 stop:3431 length:2016 start_codon:yes stop_codon:yes gene_type:complete
MEASARRIKTYLRVRPSVGRGKGTRGRIRAVESASDGEEDEQTRMRTRAVTCEMEAREDGRGRGDGRGMKQHRFAFDGVFEEEASQEAVFEEVGRDAVEAATNGFNATLFAYGQTGSGKTYTLSGGTARYEDRGIVPRALSMIFERVEKIGAEENAKFTVEVSYVEIYMEQGYDLLATTLDERESAKRGYARKSEIPLPKIRVLEDEHGRTHAMDLTSHAVASEAEALDLLFVGDTNRAVAETPLNMASSRSHCIFTVIITRRSRGADTVRRAKLNLVDLAGSERVNKSRIDGATLQEAKYINVSLHFLEQVIVALQERADGNEHTHVPYRNSLMTTLLRDSLGGNCQTIMIATASADEDAFDESVSTCRFAQRVGKISNQVFVNEELDVDALIARLREENKRLRLELALSRRAESSDVDDPSGLELAASELESLRASVRRYVDDDDHVLDCGSSIAKIRAAQEILRDMCRVAEARDAGETNRRDDATTSDDEDAAADAAADDENTTALAPAPTPVDDSNAFGEKAFDNFCRDVSRVAPELRRRAARLASLTADARSLAREMNALKQKVNVDRGALDALKIARVVDGVTAPTADEVALERALDDAFRLHAARKRALDAVRVDVTRTKATVNELKSELIHEFHRRDDRASPRRARETTIRDDSRRFASPRDG